MVPYASFPYADHALRLSGVDPNAKCTVDHIEKLIEAAHKLKVIVKDMENLDEIQGFTIYKDSTENEEDGEAVKEEMMDEGTTAMLEKFKGKSVTEFMPAFILAQFKD